MPPLRRWLPLPLLLSILGTWLLPGTAQAIEQPAYEVARVVDGIEVRDVAPYIVAEVQVEGVSREAAGNQGFRILAGYIFGQNKGERRIAMTAPVVQAPAPARIAMTAPVAQSAVEGGYRVQFMMPSAFTLDTLPEPLDPRVQLRAVPPTRLAVVRYAGLWSDRNYEDNLARLRQAVADAGLRVLGEPVYARYDPPWTPWFLRRNEIWLPVE